MAKIKFRRDTAAAWTDANPTLAQGEPGFEHDTGLFKIGDGVTAWNSLAYTGGDALTNEGAITVQTGDDSKWLIQIARDDINTWGISNDGVQTRGTLYDSQGNVVVYGSIEQGSTENIFVAKYTATGTLVWKKSFGQVVAANDVFAESSLAIDSDDNVFVAVGSSVDGFSVLKISSSGASVWTVNYTDSNNIPRQVTGMAVDQDDNLLVATWNPDSDGYVGVNKISGTTGQVVWTKKLDSETLWSSAAGITVDHLNNVIVGGYVEFDGASTDAIVAKLDTSGNLLWQKKLVMADSAVDRKYAGSTGVATDPLGNIYVTGNYQVQGGNSIGFVVAEGVSTAAFVIKLNTSGVVQWARRAGPGPCYWTGLSVTVGADGDLYLAATTVTQAFGEGSIEASGSKGYYSNNLVIARYVAATGDVVWQKYFNNSQQQIFSVTGYAFATSIIDVRGDMMIIGGASQLAADNVFSRDSDRFSTAWVAQLTTDGTTAYDLGGFSFANSRVPGRRITVTTTANTTLTAATGSLVSGSADTDTLPDAAVSTRTIRSKSHTWTFDSEGNVHTPAEGNIVLDQTELGYINFIGYENNYESDIWIQSVTADAEGYTYALGADRWDSPTRPTVHKFDPTGKRVWTVQLRSGSGASFDISRAGGTYTIDAIVSGGSNYRVGDEIVILGWYLEGESPANDLVIEALTVDGGGTVLTYEIQSGVAAAGTGISYGVADNNDDGRGEPNAIAINPLTGNLEIVAQTNGFGDASTALMLTMDPESGAILATNEVHAAGQDIRSYDIQVSSQGVKAMVGQTYGELGPETSINPEAESALGYMIVAKAGIAAANNTRYPGVSGGNDWYVSGTGIQGSAYVSNPNKYHNIPLVPRQGTGAEFTVEVTSGGPATLALGTIDVGSRLWNYGMGNVYLYGFKPISGGWGAAYGSTTGPEGGAARIYSADGQDNGGYGIFRIVLVPGNYGDYTVDSAGLLNGSFLKINLTIDGVTVELSPQASGGDPVTYSYASTNNASDNFSLSTKVGQTLSVSLVPSQAISATYTAGSDYTTVGFALNWLAGTLTMTKANWTNAGGLAAMAALTSGTTFAVEALGYNETPPYTVNIVLTSNWTDNGETFTATANIPQISNTATASNIYLIQPASGGPASYSVSVTNGGTNYLPGHKILVLGSTLGGVDATNDIIITVDELTDGAISSVTNSGTPAGASATYTAVAGTNYQVGSGHRANFIFSPETGAYGYWQTHTTGDNYVINDVITISGATFAGGATPANDIAFIVNNTRGGTNAGDRGAVYDILPVGSISISADWLSLEIQNYSSTDFSGAGAWTIAESRDSQAYIWTDNFQKSAGGLDNDWFNSVAWSPDGSIVYAAGASYNSDAGDDENIIIKFAQDGTVAWKKQLTNEFYGGESENYSIAAVEDGVVSIGRVYRNSLDIELASLFKLNLDGTLAWHKAIRTVDDSYPGEMTLAVDPATGDIVTAISAYNNTIDWQCIYLNKFDSAGNIIWKRILASSGGDRFNREDGYRALTIVGDSFYISGHTYWMRDYEQNGFVARLPLDGTGIGEHGIWSYQEVSDTVLKTYDAEGTNTVVDHPIELATTTKIASVNSKYYYTDYPTNLHPLINQVVRNGKGGALVFPDGSEQTTSAGISQQVKMGRRYTITAADAGGHIFIDQHSTDGDHYIYIPYWEYVKLPVGFKFSVVNRSSIFVYIELQSGENETGSIYGSNTYNNHQYRRWHVNPVNSNYANWVDIMKVKEGVVSSTGMINTGPEWVIRGNDGDYGTDD